MTTCTSWRKQRLGFFEKNLKQTIGTQYRLFVRVSLRHAETGSAKTGAFRGLLHSRDSCVKFPLHFKHSKNAAVHPLRTKVLDRNLVIADGWKFGNRWHPITTIVRSSLLVAFYRPRCFKDPLELLEWKLPKEDASSRQAWADELWWIQRNCHTGPQDESALGFWSVSWLPYGKQSEDKCSSFMAFVVELRTWSRGSHVTLVPYRRLLHCN